MAATATNQLRKTFGYYLGVVLRISLLILAGSFFIFLVFLFWFNWQFCRAAHLSWREEWREVSWGWRHPFQAKDYNLLFLGLDYRRDNPTFLTDTILLLTVKTQRGSYLLFSIPRDLWLPDLRTKINALYYYGRRQHPQHPFVLIKEKVQQLTGQKINNVVLLTMENVRDLVDLLGGVEVNVPHSFRDTQFPRDDGSQEVMTVSFQKGWQHFNGWRALEYMRSRKSRDPVEGTDLARERRQQQVLLALEAKLANPWLLLRKPYLLGKLYLFWRQQIRSTPPITLADFVSWRHWLWCWRGQKGRTKEYPWRGAAALLKAGYDPYFHSWVLLPRNGDWRQLREFFQQQKRALP